MALWTCNRVFALVVLYLVIASRPALADDLPGILTIEITGLK